LTLKNNLSSNHKRVLSTTAKIVHQELEEIKRILSAEKSDSKIFKLEKSYSKEEKNKLLAIIETLQKMDLEMFQNFNLEGEKLTESQILSSKATYLWTALSDSRAEKLKSFGTLDDETGAEIDGYLEKMLLEIEKMLKV